MPLLSLVLSNMTAVAAVATVSSIVLVLIMFRKNIRGAIDRWNIQPPLASSNESAPAQSEIPKQQNFINLKPDNEEARDRAAALTTILEKSSHTTEQKLALALVDLANKDLRLEYEVLFRTIYGSQFEALRALRQEGPSALASFHQLFLDRVKAVYTDSPPQHTTDFEPWVAFLLKREYPLISLNGGIASITRAGSEFLSYVASFAPPLPYPPRGL